MSPLSRETAEDLGRRLHAEGFRPLPDADDGGILIGTRLWRVRAGYVEYLALRPNGLAHAVRAEARFDYNQPANHGRIVERRSGYAVNALDWLLATSNTPASSRKRLYVPPTTTAEPEWPPHEASGP
ncbi:hypothetical protein [Saccharopolyspora rosea]|uniref:Uncharacterized protein n=1 Tax=Saccharopolyspora rosea TaxID=524884 RepID=A0ABW3FVG7_9PSEU|nr:hypothetical protein [Saccharopolyspora rosea]